MFEKLDLDYGSLAQKMLYAKCGLGRLAAALDQIVKRTRETSV